MPDRKLFFLVGPQLCACVVGELGQGKDGGRRERKKKKTYQKMIGEVKNIHSEGIQSFEILKTCEKRKKVRRGEGEA